MSLVSERLVEGLHMPRSTQNAQISGIAAVLQFNLSPILVCASFGNLEKSSSTHVLIIEQCMAHYDGNKVYDTRSRTVCRFQLFKRSLHDKGQYEEFKVVIKEYFKSWPCTGSSFP